MSERFGGTIHYWLTGVTVLEFFAVLEGASQVDEARERAIEEATRQRGRG